MNGVRLLGDPELMTAALAVGLGIAPGIEVAQNESHVLSVR